MYNIRNRLYVVQKFIGKKHISAIRKCFTDNNKKKITCDVSGDIELSKKKKVYTYMVVSGKYDLLSHVSLEVRLI